MYILKHKTKELFLNRSTRTIIHSDINEASTFLEASTAMTSLVELRTKLKMFTNHSWSEFEPIEVKLIKL